MDEDMITFELREEHVQLLRAMRVTWCDDEFGAPQIDPKRPYGNSDVEDDIREELARPEMGGKDVRELHEETLTALQVVLRTGSFEPGPYVAGRYRRDWRAA